MLRRDPLADPRPLIRRVHAYVAYYLGPGADADDVTSETIERALRYRDSYDPRKGAPVTWLIAIARRCIAAHLAASAPVDAISTADDELSPEDLETAAIARVTVRAAVAALPQRDRELVALRYGADLTARQIGDLLGMKQNAVEVALHRLHERLRLQLGVEEGPRKGSTPLAISKSRATID
jgi:RNA polymerase sigma-70 factor (ECF subfamily)